METVRSANELVYDELRDQILTTNLLPGEWLREHDLVEQFNVSRTPVREALRRLASEHLVEIIPYRGARIIKPDAEAIREEYIVRAALEGLAIELAVAHIDVPTLDKLEDSAARMEQLLDEHNITDFLSLNQQFHMTIYDLSGTERLLAMIRESWDRDNIYRMFLLSQWPAALNVEKRIHRDLLDALRKRDGERARELMKQSCFEMSALYGDGNSSALPVSR